MIDPQPYPSQHQPFGVGHFPKKAPIINSTTNNKTLEQMALDGPRILFDVDTVFPFVLFRDRIIVDEMKVTVLIGNFFKSGRERSVLVKDVANIIVDSSYFFATVQIIDRHFLTKPITVKYIWKKKAAMLRQSILGLMIAHNEGIDLSQYDDEQVRKCIIQIGSAHQPEEE